MTYAWLSFRKQFKHGSNMDITQLLAFSVKNKASDLHLSAGLPPMIRVHGDVRRINVEPLDHKQVYAMVYDIMNDGQRKRYEEFLEIDFRLKLKVWRVFV
jgi:twitching motility protein PilT